MTITRNLLSEAVRYGLAAGAVGLIGLTAAPAFAQDQEEAARLERIEVTGSRIKRADIEGALPVTVIDRQQIELSGDISVSDFLRNTSFNSFGSFRPASGSSAQGTSTLNLRGLGSSRTLILIDGRRAPIAPALGSGSDLNSIPLAAVERIEILSDGASAVYGSDAIGGVVNIITRRDFSGVEVTVGASNPSREGGETEEGSIIFGAASDRGQLLAGVSYANRGIFFTRDRPWGSTQGISSFGNNFRRIDAAGNPLSGYAALPGGCNDPLFFMSGALCSYNFNAIATDETEARIDGFFARGSYQINDDWSTYFRSNVTRSFSFGRYAPAPVGQGSGGPRLIIEADNPNNPIGERIEIRHRLAAAGPRDGETDGNTYDINFGFEGRIGNVDLDFGGRRAESKNYDLGVNYPVVSLMQIAINNGTYNFMNPSSNPRSVINGFISRISRVSITRLEELYATGSTDLFEMGGGTAGIAFGAEWRRDVYSDDYDSLSEAGVIGGSAGGSAGGSRIGSSYFAEALFPFMTNLEAGLAVRHDRYSDYGSDTSPKISVRWQPLDNLTLRASYGRGFAAPDLSILTQVESFSADGVFDLPTCAALGNPGCVNPQQVDVTVVANPDLSSEKSRQYSVGVVWDATEWLNISADFYNIKVTDAISAFTLSDLQTLEELGAPFPPGLGFTRSPLTGAIENARRGFGNLGFEQTQGVDINLNTNFDFGDMGGMTNRLQLSYVDSYEQEGIDGSVFEFIGLTGQPEMRVVMQNSYNYGDFSFGAQTNYIAKQENTAGAKTVGGWVTHDLQFTWAAPWNGRVSLGVDNVANKLPTLFTVGGRNYNRALYDAFGRVPYIRYTQSF